MPSVVRIRLSVYSRSRSPFTFSRPNASYALVRPAIRFVERSGFMALMACIALALPASVHGVQSSSTLAPSE
eukprot:scaffold131761_cov29-Tisochrysis_lutea.AAC.4